MECAHIIADNEKVLPKCGLLQLKFQLKTSPSNCFFRATKLQKNVKQKSNCDKKSRVVQLRLQPRILAIHCYLQRQFP